VLARGRIAHRSEPGTLDLESLDAALAAADAP